MPRGESQYFSKLEFLLDTQRVFDPIPYDKPFAEWTREEKARLTRLYNKARLATATQDLAKRPKPGDYAEMARLIRPFTKGFSARDGYKLNKPEQWTPAQKRKLTRYYREAVMMASRPFQVYHPPSKAHEKVAREASGQSRGYPAFKGIFVPVQTLAGEAKISVDTKRNIVEVKSRTHRTVTIDWSEYGVDFEDLATDPEGVVRDVTEQLDFTQYSIQAGEYEVGKGVPRLYTPNLLVKAVTRLVEKYNAETYDPEDTNSHYFGNWMHGIKGYEFTSRAERDEWVSRSRAEAQARKRYKSLVRKRMRYARGEGVRPKRPKSKRKTKRVRR